MLKNIRLDSTYCFIMKILNKQKLQQIVLTDNFMNFYKNVLQNHILFLFIDATYASDNPLCFGNNLSEII